MAGDWYWFESPWSSGWECLLRPTISSHPYLLFKNHILEGPQTFSVIKTWYVKKVRILQANWRAQTIPAYWESRRNFRIFGLNGGCLTSPGSYWRTWNIGPPTDLEGGCPALNHSREWRKHGYKGQQNYSPGSVSRPMTRKWVKQSSCKWAIFVNGQVPYSFYHKESKAIQACWQDIGKMM